MSDFSDTISRKLTHAVRQSKLGVWSIVDNNATAIAAHVVDICLRDARIRFIADRGVVLRPRCRGPLLAHAAGPHLAQRRQTLLPAAAVVFLVNSAVRRGQHAGPIAAHAVLRDHLRRHIVNTGPVERRDPTVKQTRHIARRSFIGEADRTALHRAKVVSDR